MRTFLITALILMLGVFSLPVTAAESNTGFHAAVMNQGTTGNLQSVGLNNDIKHMTLAQAAAIVGGAIVGGTVVDRFFDGAIVTVLGVVAGAILGNEWYERGMWPF